MTPMSWKEIGAVILVIVFGLSAGGLFVYLLNKIGAAIVGAF